MGDKNKTSGQNSSNINNPPPKGPRESKNRRGKQASTNMQQKTQSVNTGGGNDGVHLKKETLVNGSS